MSPDTMYHSSVALQRRHRARSVAVAAHHCRCSVAAAQRVTRVAPGRAESLARARAAAYGDCASRVLGPLTQTGQDTRAFGAALRVWIARTRYALLTDAILPMVTVAAISAFRGAPRGRAGRRRVAAAVAASAETSGARPFGRRVVAAHGKHRYTKKRYGRKSIHVPPAPIRGSKSGAALGERMMRHVRKSTHCVLDTIAFVVPDWMWVSHA